MKDSTYEHVCTLILGVATMFRYIGYDIGTFIVESLVHSAHARDPDAIMKHAGYYGQAVKEFSTCLGTFIVPVILNYISPKWTLVLGSSLFASYFFCFFFLNNILYFTANILLGLSFALMYTSFSMCQMVFSTKQTLARNSSRIQGFANLSLISGGLLYIFITMNHQSTATVGTASEKQYRYYSESETKMMCAFLFAFCLINLVLTCCLPSREVENSVSSENTKKKLQFTKQLKTTLSTLVDPYILLFVPRFLSNGLFVSFFMNIYPSSLHYSTHLAKQYPMMTAYYAFAMCAGTTFCGFAVSPLHRYFNDFGLRPLYYLTAGVQVLAYSIAVLTVPNWSTARPTEDSAIIEPNLLWVCLMAFLLGFANVTNAASSSVVCSRVLPGRAADTFCASRLYRGVAAAFIFFASPILTMRAHASILITITLISALSFDFAVKQTEKRQEQKADEEA